MNLLQDTTSLALAVCEKYISENETAVDCTCGRGFDTLFLAERCRKVYSFDIQDEALRSAEKLMTGNGISWETTGEASASADVNLRPLKHCCAFELPRVTFIKDSHINMRRYVKEEPGVIVFNLGYLPKGDKNITTMPKTTAEAVKLALDMIKTGGLVCVTLYPGHENGREEREVLRSFAGGLEKSRFHCVYAEMLNQSDAAPEILWITKKK